MPVKYNFEWDHKKDLDNRNKHDVAFEEAATIFKDTGALTIFDPDHSLVEDRWITMGISFTGRMLVVIHTFREEGEGSISIRIISSGKATKREIQTYRR